MNIGILHISDLHISSKTCESIDEMVKKLIKDVKKVKEDNLFEINYICFTGDLIDKGSQAISGEKQLDLGINHFIEPLIKELGIERNNFILVPGNHEVNTDEIEPMTEIGLASINNKKQLNLIIENMKPEYTKRLVYFYEHMIKGYLTDAELGDLGYSILREFNDKKIGFVGLDSSWRSSGKGDIERGNLIVGISQIEHHYRKIEDADIKICLMHHPLDWISDLEMNDIEVKLNKFDFVLSGHIHDMKDRQIVTQSYKTVYNTAGKLSPIKDLYSGYSIININADNMTCDIYSREYFPQPREDFDKGLRINKDGKVSYKLEKYNEEEILKLNLKSNLKKLYMDKSQKHEMFRTIYNTSPNNKNDYFVYPNLYNKSKYERLHDDGSEKNDDVKVSFEELIFSSDNIVFFGKREIGKTTILHKIGLSNASSNNEHIPVYINMRDARNTKNVIKLTHQFFVDNISDDIGLSKSQTEMLIKNGKILYLLDDFDPSIKSHRSLLDIINNDYQNNRFILTVEETFFQEHSYTNTFDIGIEHKCIYIDYFTKKHLRDMLKKWSVGKDDFDSNKMTNQIMSYCNNTLFSLSPFNIAVFMTIWENDRSFLPVNEGIVMQQYLDVVLNKLSIDNLDRSTFGFDLMQDFLGYIAYELFKNEKYYFTIDEFEDIVDKYHKEKGFKKSKSKFDKIFFEKNILYNNRNHVFFINTGILEYFIAFYATKEPDVYNKLVEYKNRRYVVRELIYYSGLVPNCSELLNLLFKNINETISRNLEVIENVEKINIGIEFQNDSDTMKDVITGNRRSIEEIDGLFEVTDRVEPCLTDNRIVSDGDRESFFDLLTIYGGVIKNAETMNKKTKKLHLNTYMLGINFQFGIIVDQFSSYLRSEKGDLEENMKLKVPEMTKSEFEEMQNISSEMVKIIMPIGLQSFISTNVGTQKLDIVISELMNENSNKKFTKFMLIFLYCDLGCEDFTDYLKEYIKNENSKDMLKLVVLKLAFYYRTRYFGDNDIIEKKLIDLITDAHMKVNNMNKQQDKIKKGEIKNEIKKQLDVGL